jgi:hypothetical protein
VRALHEQRAHHGVAALGYAHLWIAPARRIAARDVPEECANVAPGLGSRAVSPSVSTKVSAVRAPTPLI